MEQSSAVTIMSGSPVYSASLRQWLESGGHAFPCCLFGERDTGWDPRAPTPGTVLIAPQRWRELAFWLPCLEQQFASHAWLLLADLRLAGMFLSALDDRLCTLVAPGSSPDRLCLSLYSLAERVALCPPHSLASLIACGAPALGDGGIPWPTHKEIECGCAASFGLTNRQIAHVLRVCEGTVKTHISRLLRKLHVKDREELCVYLEQALTPWPLSLN